MTGVQTCALPISATRTAALLTGDIDFLQDVAPQDIEKLGDVPSLRLVKGPENRVMFLGFDQLRDDLVGLAKQSADRGGNPFKHLAVRQAIAYAIDVDSLRTQVMRGMSAPTWCLVPSPVPCAQIGLDGERPKFNVEVARQLLRQAGYANGFSANLDCPNNRYVNDAALCTAIAAMLAKVNVLLQVNLMPKAQFFQKLEKLESHFYLLGWGGAETDAQPTMNPLMHSKNDALAKGEDNYGQFSNAELDRLIDLAAVEADSVKRLEYVGSALKIHSGQVHHLPLHRQVLVWAMRSNVTTPPAANNHFRAWLTNMGAPSIGLSSASRQ